MVRQIAVMYQAIVDLGTGFESILLFFMRVYWGGFYLKSGIIKLANVDVVAAHFVKWQIPCPTCCVYLVGTTHLIGGLCLIFGCAARWASVPLAFTMLIAYLSVHRSAFFGFFSDPNTFMAQPPFLFLLTNITIILFGSGKYALDNFFEIHFKHHRSAV